MVRVRIEGATEQEVRDAAIKMGVTLEYVKPMRNGLGVMAYGTLRT